MRAYYEIIRITIKNSVVYKLDALISTFGSFITLFVQIFLWKALYQTNRIDNVSLSEMVTYQIFGIILSILYINTVASEVGNKVTDGSISMELIRPYNFAVSMFSKTIGNTISGFLIKGITVILFVIIFYNFRFKISLMNTIILGIVIIFNVVIYWLMHYIIGLLHFVLINAGWFVRILGDTIRILGGSIIPLWFFPSGLKQVSLFLPFQLLYQFPQSILINKVSIQELIFNLTVEVSWVIILSLASFYLWQLGTKRLVIQGG